MSEPNKCSECGQIDWHSNTCSLAERCSECSNIGWHSSRCSRAPIAEYVVRHLRYDLDAAVKKAKVFEQKAKRYKEELRLFQGKFHVVRHENNQLRRKLNSGKPGEEPKPNNGQ